MITKQQALEFIYELSQKYEVTINSYIGTLEVKNNDYDVIYDTPAIDKGLEGAVQEFIKLYPEIAEKASDKIPVDIDMLEVGKNYSFKIDQGWKKTYYTDTFKGFKKVTDDIEVLSFEHNDNIVKWEVAEIYRIKEVE